jgi:RHH-type proline utilization regulon transcriptional repressor/proline dehydrogenase/delta 1-pyrroline-5-carboxylate dehydrogenase
MLVGAMAELRVGDRGLLATDVGPGIDPDALDALQAHVRRMEREAQLLYRGHLGEPCRHGAFIAPCAYEIESISRLDREFFGPILHVVRFRRQDLDFVIDSINGTGYGLTLGVHTRIDGTMEHIRRRMRVGNLYVNRSQIGAVVGVQPFGGERRWQDGKTERTRSGLDLCLF